MTKNTGTSALIVEVLSESTRRKDMLKKLNLYFYGGVKEYWIVSPHRKEVYVYAFAEQDIEEYRVYRGDDTAMEGVHLRHLVIATAM